MKKAISLFASILMLFSSAKAQIESSGWKSLAASNHSMMLDGDGKIWVTGSNRNGELGNGCYGDFSDDANLSTPIVLEKSGWEKVIASSFSSMAIHEDGTLWAWGSNTYGQLGNPTVSMYSPQLTPLQVGTEKWMKVAMRSSSCIGIQVDGSLWLWGNNDSGQLAKDPEEVATLNSPKQYGTDRWLDCASGFYHSVALKADGTIWAWGKNNKNQVNELDVSLQIEPIQVGTDADWIAVYAGISSTYGLKKDGSLWGWGNNERGQIGDGTKTDVSKPYKLMENAASVAVGDMHVLVIRQDGTLWGVGYNLHSELGDGTAEDALTPKQLGTAKWKMIAAGSYHSIGVQEDGSLWTWGWNRYGQLGNGNNTTQNLPVMLAEGKPSGIFNQENDQLDFYIESGELHIESKTEIAGVTLYTTTGSQLANKMVCGCYTTMNMSILPDGIYLAKIIFTDGREVVCKIIK